MDNFEFINLMEQTKRQKVELVTDYQKRDIYYEITKLIKKRKRELFIYYGLRGIGKSTTLYQLFVDNPKVMFIDGTVLSYYNLDLVSTVSEYLKYNESKILLIDEITEIDRWAKSLKVLYDNYNLIIICTGSSAIGISTKNKEIVRRALFKEISPLTFKEFLRLKHNITIDFSTRELFISNLSDSYAKAKSLFIKLPDLSKEFNEYLKTGFPLSFERPIEYTSESILSKIIADDFPQISGFNIEIADISKKIINTLALSQPDQVALSKFSKAAKCSRTTVSNVLNSFVLSSLIIPVLSNKKSTAKVRKEPKYLFSSSALRYGLAKLLVETPEVGVLREDAVVSSFKYLGFTVEYVSGLKKRPDYLIRLKNKEVLIEVGGPSKKYGQLDKGILLIDSNKIDYNGKVLVLPLWFVGLM